MKNLSNNSFNTEKSENPRFSNKNNRKRNQVGSFGGEQTAPKSESLSINTGWLNNPLQTTSNSSSKWSPFYFKNQNVNVYGDDVNDISYNAEYYNRIIYPAIIAKGQATLNFKFSVNKETIRTQANTIARAYQDLNQLRALVSFQSDNTTRNQGLEYIAQQVITADVLTEMLTLERKLTAFSLPRNTQKYIHEMVQFYHMGNSANSPIMQSGNRDLYGVTGNVVLIPNAIAILRNHISELDKIVVESDQSSDFANLNALYVKASGDFKVEFYNSTKPIYSLNHLTRWVNMTNTYSDKGITQRQPISALGVYNFTNTEITAYDFSYYAICANQGKGYVYPGHVRSGAASNVDGTSNFYWNLTTLSGFNKDTIVTAFDFLVQGYMPTSVTSSGVWANENRAFPGTNIALGINLNDIKAFSIPYYDWMFNYSFYRI